VYVQPSDSNWVTPNAAAPVPRFGAVTLPAAPRAPFADPRQTSVAQQPPLPPALSTSSSIPLPPPPAGQPPSMLARFGAPLAAASTARSATGDGTETITVTNVVSAPAINKLGSLFNSLNKTVTGALNTFITQQQQQPQTSGPGSWQPAGQQQFNPQQQQLQQPQQPQHSAPTDTPVQRFPAAPLPQALPATMATAFVPPPVPLQPQLQPPQQPAGAPRFPSDASSAFVRVGPAVDPLTRPDVPPPQQHRPPAEHHQAAPPPPIRDHVQQQPHLTQSHQFGETYREMPRNHVDPRMQLAPAGRGKCFNKSNFNNSSPFYRYCRRRQHVIYCFSSRSSNTVIISIITIIVMFINCTASTPLMSTACCTALLSSATPLSLRSC